MAKRKDIANLISGICGEKSTPATEENTALTQEQIERLQITEEMQEQLNAKRRAKVGRPKMGETKAERTDEGRATFVVSNTLIKKLKYISLCDGRLLKDILSEMMEGYITDWEENNRKIEL